MDKKRIFSILLFIFGVFLIIVSFLHFGNNMPPEVKALNIVVTSVIYGLFFVDILISPVRLDDQSQKNIGSMGVRWFFTFCYTLSAIGVMIYFNNKENASIGDQLIIQSILFFLLLLGLYFSFSSARRTLHVYEREKESFDGINEMKNVISNLQMKMDTMKDLPQEFISAINIIQEDIRYMSPSLHQEAVELETQFIHEIEQLADCLSATPLRMEKIEELAKSSQKILKKRKQAYS